jgi:methionyl aminopeptidase
MGEARGGARLNRIGYAIERVARAHGFGVIRNLGSHGVGRSLHEEPKFIPGYYRRLDFRKLRAGMVITIEPFLTTGASDVVEMADGWTLRTRGGISAQFEHTLILTDGDPIVCTEPSI